MQLACTVCFSEKERKKSHPLLAFIHELIGPALCCCCWHGYSASIGIWLICIVCINSHLRLLKYTEFWKIPRRQWKSIFMVMDNLLYCYNYWCVKKALWVLTMAAWNEKQIPDFTAFSCTRHDVIKHALPGIGTFWHEDKFRHSPQILSLNRPRHCQYSMLKNGC